MKFIVVDIGCLECRELSTILGIYDTLADAEKNHPNATYIMSESNVRYAQGQEQILTFPPTAVPDID